MAQETRRVLLEELGVWDGFRFNCMNWTLVEKHTRPDWEIYPKKTDLDWARCKTAGESRAWIRHTRLVEPLRSD